MSHDYTHYASCEEYSKEELMVKLEEAQKAARELLIGMLAEMRFSVVKFPVISFPIVTVLPDQPFLKRDDAMHAVGVPGRAEQTKEYWEKKYPFLKRDRQGDEPA